MLDKKWTGVTTLELAAPGAVGSSSTASGTDFPSTGKPTRRARPDELYTDAGGVTWKGDTLGRWYALDAFGSRSLKSSRPVHLSSDVWSRMTPKQKKECIEHYAKLAKEKKAGSDEPLRFITGGVTGSTASSSTDPAPAGGTASSADAVAPGMCRLTVCSRWTGGSSVYLHDPVLRSELRRHLGGFV